VIELETERMKLRQLRGDDVNVLFKLNSDPEVMRYVGTGKPQQSLEEARETLKRYQSVPEKHPGFNVWAAVEKFTDTFFGLTFLIPYAPTNEVEVGYRFLKKHWNKGYATEATVAAIDYGLHQLGLDRIIAIAYPENRASTRVMEKAGMKSEGTILNPKIGVDVAYYAIEKNSS